MVELISEIETKLVGAPSGAMDMSDARETSRTPIRGFSPSYGKSETLDDLQGHG